MNSSLLPSWWGPNPIIAKVDDCWTSGDDEHECGNDELTNGEGDIFTLGASPCEVVGAWIEWNYRTTGNLIIKATLMTSIIANCHAVVIPKPNTQRKILQHLTFPLVKSFSASRDSWLWPSFLFLLFLTLTPHPWNWIKKKFHPFLLFG